MVTEWWVGSGSIKLGYGSDHPDPCKNLNIVLGVNEFGHLTSVDLRKSFSFFRRLDCLEQPYSRDWNNLCGVPGSKRSQNSTCTSTSICEISGHECPWYHMCALKKLFFQWENVIRIWYRTRNKDMERESFMCKVTFNAKKSSWVSCLAPNKLLGRGLKAGSIFQRKKSMWRLHGFRNLLLHVVYFKQVLVESFASSSFHLFSPYWTDDSLWKSKLWDEDFFTIMAEVYISV